jgi:DnaJ-class molecular chaperone
MEFKDYYATLGVTKTATDKEIKQAYRKLARKLHPDVNPGDKASESRFKDINEAYEVLGDPGKRQKYDELGANWRMYEQAQQAYGQQAGRGGPAGHQQGPFTWTWTSGGPGGFDGVEIEDVDGGFGEGSPFSDFFRTFFSGGGEEPGRRGRVSSRGSRRRQGNDVEQDVHLTLEEAYRGVTQRISIKLGGHARTLDVRIPVGIRDGARVRVASEGEPGSGGGPSGDLYLKVRLLSHPHFERKGDDLHARATVPVSTAVLGGQASVPTLSGRLLRLRIPETTQAGQVFRLRGHGMPVLGKPDQHGDLFVTVDVELPKALTDEQRRHYQALAGLEEGQEG